MSSPPNAIDLAFTRPDGSGTLVEPTFSGALSFARRRYTKNLTGVDVAVVGLPFDLATTSRPGARFGPRGVREASAMVAWDRVHGWEYDPFEQINVIDFGDVVFSAGLDATIPAEIEAQFKAIHETGTRTLMLGGDHFSTYPVLKALRSTMDEPLSLIHFDAHSDTWSEDGKSVNHGTMFFHAAKEALVAPERSIQIGLRTYNPESHGFHRLTAEAVREMGVAAVVEQARALVGDHPVYITFDIDCLDPAFAPGTGTPVVGGLTSMEAQQCLRGLRGVDLRGADVVEVAPLYDVSQITSLAAATLAMNLIGVFAEAKRA